MSFGNPWAWLGLLALAVPIAIHLLARRTARVQRFPTLRFLEASRLQPRRYTRLTDLPLLVIRLSIVFVAVAALARPLFLPADRSQTFDQLVRAIVIDTSSSMLRPTADGQPALTAARVRARTHAAEAQTSIVLETASPAEMLTGAAEWLRTKPGRRELVVVSDFQRGSIAESDVRGLPQDIGITLDRVEAVTQAGPIAVQTRIGNAIANAQTTLTDDRTTVEWQVQPAAAPAPISIVQLAAAADSMVTDAALSAALSVAAPPIDSTHRVAIVYSNYDRRAQLLNDAMPVETPWMGDVAAAINQDGIERIATGTVGGREHLLLFTNTPPGSLASAELMLAILQALSPAAPEFEPQTVPVELLQRWQRPAPRAVELIDRDDDASDGRWLWLLALLLLGVEAVMRRATRKSPEIIPAEPGYERVA